MGKESTAWGPRGLNSTSIPSTGKIRGVLPAGVGGGEGGGVGIFGIILVYHRGRRFCVYQKIVVYVQHIVNLKTEFKRVTGLQAIFFKLLIGISTQVCRNYRRPMLSRVVKIVTKIISIVVFMSADCSWKEMGCLGRSMEELKYQC